jgi:NADPH:quinone reductase-like Zn-dependent oxidoreductase
MMRAVICPAYGPPDVLQLGDVPTPSPKPNEVLVKIHAASIGPAHCAFRKGDPWIIKLFYGLSKPRQPIPGSEFAGEIVAVGGEVQTFRVGERVVGLNLFGTYAEYICLPETALLVPMPPQMSYEEAVAISDGALTALVFLRDGAHLQPGQRILINGASGAVGSAAVQLAKYYGANITGVCSSRNLELVKSLGADQVIDYTKSDFAASGERYHCILDAVGKRSFSDCQAALTDNGIYLTTVLTMGNLLDMARTAIRPGKKAQLITAGLRQNRENLAFLNELFEAGQLRAVIDRSYSLEQAAEAHRYVETERKIGNVILKVVDN